MPGEAKLEVKEGARFVVAARQARGIPKKDVRGHADPFVVPVIEKPPASAFAEGKVTAKAADRVRVEALSKSKICKNTPEPVWDYIHVVNAQDLKEPEKLCVTFYVWDKDKLSKDDFIGSFSLPLTSVGTDLIWGKLTTDKGEPVGMIECGIKLQKPVTSTDTAVCKFCHEKFDIEKNGPKSCMKAMYHAALSKEQAEGLPAQLDKKAAVEAEKKQCKWCNEFFTFASNSPKACGGTSAHAARSTIRPPRGAKK